MFRDEDIEKEKGVILEEIKMEADQPGLPGPRDLLRQFLEGPSARQADSGHARERQALRPRRMVESYYKQVYAPANMLVTAAGNLTHDGLVELVAASISTMLEAGADAARDPVPQHARAHRAAQQEVAGAGAPLPGRALVSRCRTRSVSPATS